MSRDAVANTSPSCAHAQSQTMRPCDLSAATGRYPPLWSLARAPGAGAELSRTAAILKPKQSPGAVSGNRQDMAIVRAEGYTCDREVVTRKGLAEGLPIGRVVHADDCVLCGGGFACGSHQPFRAGDRQCHGLRYSSGQLIFTSGRGRAYFVSMSEHLFCLRPEGDCCQLAFKWSSCVRARLINRHA